MLTQNELNNIAKRVNYKDGALYWNLQANVGFKNKRAGTLKSNGYRCIGYKTDEGKYKTYSEHRLIFQMVNGLIPDDVQIDHINGVRDDNRIENLRLATPAQNSANADSKPGKSGVRNIAISKSGKHKVSFTHEGKRIHCGQYPTEEMALAVCDFVRNYLQDEYAFNQRPCKNIHLLYNFAEQN